MGHLFTLLPPWYQQPEKKLFHLYHEVSNALKDYIILCACNLKIFLCFVKVEKYRPTKIDEVSHQDEVLATLRSCLTGSDVPHLLFYGPPGTGKTTTILAFCKELYGPDLWR